MRNAQNGYKRYLKKKPGYHYSKQNILLSCFISSTGKPHNTTVWLPVRNISHTQHNNLELDKQPHYEILQFNNVFLICKPIFAYTNYFLSKTIICSWRFFSVVVGSKIISNVQKSATPLCAQNRQHRSYLVVPAALL
jgi:hypothetical protein